MPRGHIDLKTTHRPVNIGKTCRTLYQVALPLVYREFDIAELEHYNVLSFLRIINLRPNLAALVHELRMIDTGIYIKTEKDWRFILKEADRRGISLPHDWSPFLGEEDARYREQYNLSVGILADLFFSTTMQIRNMSLEVNVGIKYGVFMPPLARLLSLQVLFSGFGQCQTSQTHSHLVWQGPWDIAKAFPRLETFFLDDEWVYDDPQSLTPSSIPEALLPCTNTLRHIEIYLGRMCRSDAELITSFKEFTALENLLLSGNCLFRVDPDERGHDTIYQAPVPFVDLTPASVKTFGINGSFLHLCEHMLTLAREVKGGKLPRLQHLKWTGFYESILPSGFDSLKDALRDSGVTLKLQYGDIPNLAMVGWQ
ncbi:hypothetical protein NM208_g7575 [Fusarium decemcellulare]|uniref:Uncharacterized protein n=1 Tax=Fusarium decemcellulare TaxID=57161 RepID=A0ACC1S8T5_9HYPO|nr:hypothetical protein NM208_g7575 [Fusarium decemcellulare]